MAIPEKALELNEFDISDLTMDFLDWADPDVDEMTKIIKLRRFLVERSNWTEKEIGAIKFGELKTISEQLVEAIQRAAIPLSSSSSLKTGPG